MENLKLGLIPYVPHAPYITRKSNHSSNNTIQETREMTKEEKNVGVGLVIMVSIFLIIFIIYGAISIHKLSK